MSEASDIPRRHRMDQWTPAEKAIFDAVQVVEHAGADPRLTDAVRLLDDAQRAVADFVDGVPDHFAGSQTGGVGARYGVSRGEIADTFAWFTSADMAVTFAEEGEKVFDLVTGQPVGPAK